MAFSPDGERLATVGQSSEVHLWDLSDPVPRFLTLNGHAEGVVFATAFNEEGTLLVTGGKDRTVRTWDPETGERDRPPIRMGARSATSRSARTSRCSSSALPTAALPVSTPSPASTAIDTLEGRRGRDVGGLGLTGRHHGRDRKRDGAVVVWRLSMAHRLGRPPGCWMSRSIPRATSSPTRTMEARCISGRRPPVVPSAPPLRGHTGQANAIAISPDGRRLASVSDDGTVVVWSLDDASHDLSAAVRPSGASSGTSRSARTAHLLATVGGDRTVILWDVATGEQTGPPLVAETDLASGALMTSLAFSPDGSQLAVSNSRGSVLVWDVSTRREILPPMLGGHGREIAAQSPSARMDVCLASGSSDGSIQFWDAATHEAIGEPIPAHHASVTSLDFSPDGTTLASGGSDNTIAFWTVETHELIGGPLPASAVQVYGLDFSGDGRFLASGGANGSVFMHPASTWTDSVSELTTRLCAVAGRNLTTAEWEGYLPFRPYRETCGPR